MNKFEKALTNPFIKYMNRLFWLFVVNFIFCLLSVLTIFVLFVPGLVSLHTIAYKMVNNDCDKNPVIIFFEEIKIQWSFSWRLEVLTMSILLVTGTLYYFDWLYIYHNTYDWFVWFSIIFISVFLLVGISIFTHLLTFNNYIKDDTFKMMIKKSALITGKKFLKTLLNIAILISFVVVLYLIPYLIPFISFAFYAYIVEAINKKMYSEIAKEELERMCLEENLFLPTVVEEKENKNE